MSSDDRISPRHASLGAMLIMGLLAVGGPAPAIAEDAASRDYRRGDSQGHEHQRSMRHDGHDRQGRQARGHHYPGSDVDIIIDGSRIGERFQPVPPREHERRHGGPDICHQATGTTWSTQALDCPDPQPRERSRRWSTSPD